MVPLDAFVEAEIVSLHVDPRKKWVEIVFRTVKGDLIRLNASDVDEFQLSEMRLANVVESVKISGRGQPLDGESAAQLFFAMRGRMPNKGEDISWAPYRERVGLLESGKYAMFEVRAIHGAVVTLLARHLEFLP